MAKYNTPEEAYQAALEAIEEVQRDGAKELSLSNFGLDTLPSEIGNLTNLTTLRLRNNQLSALPEWFQHLTNLTTLDLRNNPLPALPDDFQLLTNLITLSLSDTQLSALPDGFQHLTNLTQLYLSFTPLSTLPDGFQHLTNLTELYLSYTQLSVLPDCFQHLTNLTELYLSFTQLSALPDWFHNLTNLTTLSLGGNQLSTLPNGFQHLTNLTTLDLSDTPLTSLPEDFQHLKKLERLYLRNTKLSALPNWFHRLTNLKELDLRSIPDLDIPPEILEDYNNPQAILEYIAGMQVEKGRRLNEAKIMLVGQGSVGKTSLVNRLVHQRYHSDEEKTPGVNVTDWMVKDGEEEIEVHVWDFGGQEIMHATHQFFLTRRSLYLLVLDCRLSEEDNRLDYWLEIINTFGKDSPIIVVGNKVDQHPLELDMPGLQKKYPAIQAFVATSAKENLGLDDLQDLIEEQVTQLPNVKDSLPQSWFNLKERLEAMEDTHISYADYQSMCAEEGLEEADTQESVLRFLHELGVVFAFREEGNIPLQATQVLNPNWVTQGVYKILNDVELNREKGGIFGWPDLRRVLPAPDYPTDTHRGFIMELMRKFERAFAWELGRWQRFLVPDLLSKSEVPTGDWDDALKFEYHYEVLLPGLISRIMVRHHEEIIRNLSWRTGAVFDYDGNQALIQADKAKDTIRIAVRGEPATRRDYLAHLRMDIESINQRLNVEVSQHVPIPGHPDILVNYQLLKDMAKMGEDYIIPAGLMERIPLKMLLGEYISERESELEAEEERSKKLQEEIEKGFQKVDQKLGEVQNGVKKVHDATKTKPATTQKWVWQFLGLVIGTIALLWASSSIEVDTSVLLIEIVILLVIAVFLLTQQGKMSGKEAAGIYGKIADWIGKINPFYKTREGVDKNLPDQPR